MVVWAEWVAWVLSELHLPKLKIILWFSKITTELLRTWFYLCDFKIWEHLLHVILKLMQTKHWHFSRTNLSSVFEYEFPFPSLKSTYRARDRVRYTTHSLFGFVWRTDVSAKKHWIMRNRNKSLHITIRYHSKFSWVCIFWSANTVIYSFHALSLGRKHQQGIFSHTPLYQHIVNRYCIFTKNQEHSPLLSLTIPFFFFLLCQHNSKITSEFKCRYSKLTVSHL